jgi:hypothetical protein
LTLDPEEAATITEVIVEDAQDTRVNSVPVPLDPNPFCDRWPAGAYKVSAKLTSTDPRFMNVDGESVPVLPPRHVRKVKVAR